MRRSTDPGRSMLRRKKGYYTLEAAIFLPLIVLTILSLGYFTRIEGIWENCVHCAADESARASAMAYAGISAHAAGAGVRARILKEEIHPDSVRISRARSDYSWDGTDHLCSYVLRADIHMALPAGFSRDFSLKTPVLYRNFIGKDPPGDGLGAEGLQNGLPADPVWIFPSYGEKYHARTCSFVSASVHREYLTAALKRNRSACSTCRSGEIPVGSIVFCFGGEDTAYHRGSCRTMRRQTIVIDRTEAVEKGYLPCSKCGGAISERSGTNVEKQ